MMYRDRAQAVLECELNEREIGGSWGIRERQDNGATVYQPIQVTTAEDDEAAAIAGTYHYRDCPHFD